MKTLDRSVWQRMSPNFPAIGEYMRILPEASRIVSAVVVKDDPIRYAPIAVDYEVLGEGSIRTRLRLDSPWHYETFRIQDNILYWNYSGREWPWVLLPDSELPLWFSDFEKKAQNRMDERANEYRSKQAEQVGDSDAEEAV